MLEPWNDSSLLPPPVNMFLCNQQIDIPALKNVCNNIIKVLSKQSPLHKESALCSRFIYKYDRKFRNDIGYRNLKKVHTALKKYLSLNLFKEVESFLSALPSENDDEKYLPTKQMLEYLMLRIITFSMIMLRVCVCSKQGAIFYLNRLKRGEAHWMSLLPYALLSRLWSMAMILVQHSATWYSNLYSYLYKLEAKGLNFLPQSYKLPEDLEKLLNLKNVDHYGKFNWYQKNLVDENALSLDDDEDNLFDNILCFINQSNENDSVEELETLTEKVCQLNAAAPDQGQSRESYKIDIGAAVSRDSFIKDQGEKLSRESFNLLLNANSKNIKEVQKKQGIEKTSIKYKNSPKIEVSDKINKMQEDNEHSAKNVTNTVSLKQFINMEEQFRNESNSRMLTDHLSHMQWHVLKNALVNLCNSITSRKIERKFHKIWKEKCLDYK